MQRSRIAALAALVTLPRIVLQYGTSALLRDWNPATYDGLLPTFGTAGQTFTVYSMTIGIVVTLITFLLAGALGYYVAERTDFRREFEGVVGAIAGGSALAVVGLWIAFAAWSSLTGPAGFVTGALWFAAFSAVTSLANLLLQETVVVTVVAVAVAAATEFRRENDPASGLTVTGDAPGSEVDEGTSTESDPATEPATETASAGR